MFWVMIVMIHPLLFVCFHNKKSKCILHIYYIAENKVIIGNEIF